MVHSLFERSRAGVVRSATVAGVLLAVCGSAPCAAANGGGPLPLTHFVAQAGERDHQLDELFATLQSAKSQSEADAVVAQIWSIWNTSGSDVIDELMQFALALMNMAAFAQALDVLNTVVQQAPGYAEGWNRRATSVHRRSARPLSEGLRGSAAARTSPLRRPDRDGTDRHRAGPACRGIGILPASPEGQPFS